MEEEEVASFMTLPRGKGEAKNAQIERLQNLHAFSVVFSLSSASCTS